LPTGNAILLFGKKPRNKFPQAAVKAKVQYPVGKTGTATFDDALVLIPDKVTALGMATFKSIREKHNLPLPIIEFDGLNVVVTFPRTIEVVKELSPLKGIAKLNDEELTGYEFVKMQSTVKRKEYEEKFGFDKKKAERHLNKMAEEGLIERKGSGPATYYEVIAT